MRGLAPVLVLTLLATDAASAQDAPKRRRMTVVPPSAGGAAAVAPAAGPGAALAAPKPVSALPPPSSLRLIRPSPVSDAPQCRAQCAQSRYACSAQMSDGDGGECDSSWTQCVVACGAGAYRYSDTAPQIFTKTFAPR